MDFPQYLWRIGNRKRAWMIRRGNTVNEPIDKFMDKDMPRLLLEARAELPVGILTYCAIDDNHEYSKNHPWDWFNEEGFTRRV